MKRLVVIISTFLILAGMHGENVGAGEIFWFYNKVPARMFSAYETMLSDSDQRFYAKWVQSNGDGYKFALALSFHGWAAAYSSDIVSAKRQALRMCNRLISSNQCRIVDVNGTSTCINRRFETDSVDPRWVCPEIGTIEQEFWKTIKDSDDPDMFQAYLDEYPNGKFAPLAKIMIKKLGSSSGDY